LIDLHMHTTASDGLLSPAALVARVAAVGLTTISVTDHDTVAAFAEVRALTDAAKIRLIPGIEVTSVHNERDVHILGYFIDPSDAGLAAFLTRSRLQRVERAREIASRLDALGCPIDIDEVIRQAARRGASLARPLIADALMRQGHVATRQEAFDRFLATGQPAFVPRVGAAPAAVVAAIHQAQGVASFAHPGITRQPELIESLARQGLDAIEAYHTDHTPQAHAEAMATARRLQLAVSGGSDYHGDDERRRLGGVMLPHSEFEDLEARRVTRLRS
jgi:predicted metal-dependent phosphoesterase TrpH